MEFSQSKEHIIQNLVDAGCDEKFISLFLEEKEYDKPDQILLLLEQRDLILEKLHKVQETIRAVEGAIQILPEDDQ